MALQLFVECRRVEDMDSRIIRIEVPSHELINC